MKLNDTPRQRPQAMAGFRAGLFVGYALHTAEGWICVIAVGMGWSKSLHRTADDARTCLRSTAHAADFDWFTSIEQLEQRLQTLPESSMPSIMPEMLNANLGRWQRLSLN